MRAEQPELPLMIVLWLLHSLATISVLLFALLFAAGTSGGGFHGLLRREALGALWIAACAAAVMFLAAFATPVTGSTPDWAEFALAFLAALPASFLAARRLTPGWAPLGAIGVLIGCGLALTIGTYIAHAIAWHGLDREDLGSDDLSPEAATAVALALGAWFAALPGAIVGAVAAFRSHRPVASSLS